MRIDILTLFPEAFDSFLHHSIVKRALAKGAISVRVHDLREYTHDRHRSCDDKPFGGGPGMLLKPEPIFEAMEKLFGRRKPRFVYFTPSGKHLDQKTVRKFAREKHIVLLCGHYEGVDQRVIDGLVTDEVSIGDYVLTGGELPAMVLVDALARLQKGVLGNQQSNLFESFSGNLLEYPQYTRPAEYRGRKVPAILLSGDHARIAKWREAEAVKRTRKRRPDLLRGKKS